MMVVVVLPEVAGLWWWAGEERADHAGLNNGANPKTVARPRPGQVLAGKRVTRQLPGMLGGAVGRTITTCDFCGIRSGEPTGTMAKQGEKRKTVPLTKANCLVCPHLRCQ